LWFQRGRVRNLGREYGAFCNTLAIAQKYLTKYIYTFSKNVTCLSWIGDLNFADREVTGKLKNDLYKRIHADTTTSIFIKQMALKCQLFFNRRKEDQNDFHSRRDLLCYLIVPHSDHCLLHFLPNEIHYANGYVLMHLHFLWGGESLNHITLGHIKNHF